MARPRKLSDEAALDIRTAKRYYGYLKVLVHRHNVCPCTIWRIRRGLTYKRAQP